MIEIGANFDFDDDFDDVINEYINSTQILNENETNKYSFPFTPYEIQKDFAEGLFNTIEKSQIGIFESPTGTGKSLSIICGALTWLISHQSQKKMELEKLLEEKELNKIDGKGDLYWLHEHSTKQDNNEKIVKIKDEFKKIEELDERIDKSKIIQEYLKTNKYNSHLNFKEPSSTIVKEIVELRKSDMILKQKKDKYVLDIDETNDVFTFSTKIYYCSRTHSQLGQFLRELNKTDFIRKHRFKVALLGSRKSMCINENVRGPDSNKTPLWIMNEKCLQMIKQGKKSQLDGEIEVDAASDFEDNNVGTTCGKRKSGKESKKACEFYDKLRIDVLRDVVLADTMDIEDLVKEGKEVEKACPYYASRLAAADAQLILLPYNLIFQPEARRANNINLDGNVVIIDEAHNLIEAVSSMHSVEMGGLTLLKSFYQLAKYHERYSSRFNPDNLINIQHLTGFVEKLITFLQTIPQGNVEVLEVKDLLYRANLDNYNYYKLHNFMTSYLLCQKFMGINLQNDRDYLALITSRNASSQNVENGKKKLKMAPLYEMENYYLEKFFTLHTNKPKIGLSQIIAQKKLKTASSIEDYKCPDPQLLSNFGSPLTVVQNFLNSLIDYNNHSNVSKTRSDQKFPGKIFVCKKISVAQSVIKYVMLDVSSGFSDILNTARSVILAGGTMKPVEELKERIFYPLGVAPDRIYEFECGHIIPKDNLLVASLSNLNNIEMDFTYQKRNDASLLQSVGLLLLELVKVVPGGIICFFTSYQYENIVWEKLSASGILSQITKYKDLFREARNSTNYEISGEIDSTRLASTDNILERYSKAIKCYHGQSPKSGAILFSVINGKMSEGINFNDDLARCILVFGMPYPNLKDPELAEKLKYYNFSSQISLNSNDALNRDHYNNMCMKAVNQCIGRAIRHKDDYASIILCDKRYVRSQIKDKLPKWIKENVDSSKLYSTDFSVIKSEMIQFFKRHQKRE